MGINPQQTTAQLNRPDHSGAHNEPENREISTNLELISPNETRKLLKYLLNTPSARRRIAESI